MQRVEHLLRIFAVILGLFVLPQGESATAGGRDALRANTTGDGNTASGAGALFLNTTGIANTASGAGALHVNTIGSGNTASGRDALRVNTTGSGNTAIGSYALFSNNTGGANTAGGNQALSSNISGNHNTAVGYRADVSVGHLTNATAIGADAIVNASNKIQLGNPQVTLVETSGDIRAKSFIAASDRNHKENFQSIDGEEVLAKLRTVPVTSWNFVGRHPEERRIGPMAQDFHAAFGNDGIGKIGSETTIHSGDMAGILMIAIQALERQNRAQMDQINDLKAKNIALKADLARMQTDHATEMEHFRADLAQIKRVMGQSGLATQAVILP